MKTAMCKGVDSEHAGKTYDCAGQKLSGKQICGIYKKILIEKGMAKDDGKTIAWKPVLGPCLMSLGLLPDFGAMHKFWVTEGYPVDQESQERFRTVLGSAAPWTVEDYFRWS